MPAASKPKTLAEALFAVQGAGLKIVKGDTNPAFGRGRSYAGLPTVMAAVLPALHAEGVLLTQALTNLDGAPAITTALTLAATGEQVSATAPLVLSKQDSQGVGSAVTYMRRYSVLSMLGLTPDEDDDGNAASGPAQTQAYIPAVTMNQGAPVEASDFGPAL